MNAKTIRVLKALLKEGTLNRAAAPELWSVYQEPEVQDEMEVLKRELDFELWGTSSRVYLIPNQSNDLFLQNNMDFRRDIKAPNDFRLQDLYLLNYLSIFLLCEFFRGEGSDPQVRDFIEQEELLHLFTEHCDTIQREEKLAEQAERKYSMAFVNLARQWSSLIYGESGDSAKKLTTKWGRLNAVMAKFQKEDIFLVSDGKIRPTQKCRDLMPYFLRRERVQDIHSFLKGGKTDAADQ